jgi:pSer/pThr/pTyr-binding forkhead associated (FHA) protein
MPAPELPPAPPPLRPVMPPPAPMPPPSPRPAAPLPYTVVPEAAAPPTQMAPEAVPPTVAMQKPEAPAARLVGTEGALAGKRFDLFHSKTATLGRDPHQVTILLEDTTVSRHHADIRFENGRFIVADQNALNGTFVNNQRVQGLAVLSNGDAVRFGNVTLKFEEV